MSTQMSQVSTENPSTSLVESFTPLNDQLRGMGIYGEMLVEGLEGFTYYQRAKALVSELFIGGLTKDTGCEMPQELVQLHIDLHASIQELFDSVHKEYRTSLQMECKRIIEQANAPKP